MMTDLSNRRFIVNAIGSPQDDHRRPSDSGGATRAGDLREMTVAFAERRASVRRGTSEAIRRQHSSGRLTARERLGYLFDEGSFTELDTFRKPRKANDRTSSERIETDGVIIGWGHVYGRIVFAYAQDAQLFGGTLGEEHASKIHKIMDLARRAGKPLVGLNDGGGARIQEGIAALSGYGGIFRRQVGISGQIPQISVVLGACAGGAAYSPALADFVFMVEGTSQMFVTGSKVLAEVTGETVTNEDLGGTAVHAELTGVAHRVHADEAECLEEVRYLLSLLPENCRENAPEYDAPRDVFDDAPELLDIVPRDPRSAYDVKKVISVVLDGGDFFELQESWGKSLVCGLGRLDGCTVGLVANQPLVNAGALDAGASAKGARFVQMCDAFGIPLITLVDVPGFLPGIAEEHGGIIRHGAQLVYAYCNSRVPRVSVILRKAYGGAYIVMDSRSIGCDVTLAWPTNEVAVMGAAGAVSIIHGRELRDCRDRGYTRAALMSRYEDEFLNPFVAVEQGLVDEIIEPQSTRRALASALHMLTDGSHGDTTARHGNPPQ